MIKCIISFLFIIALCYGFPRSLRKRQTFQINKEPQGGQPIGQSIYPANQIAGCPFPCNNPNIPNQAAYPEYYNNPLNKYYGHDNWIDENNVPRWYNQFDPHGDAGWLRSQFFWGKKK